MENKYVDFICQRLSENMEFLRGEWTRSKPVKHFFIDDLLPKDFALEIASNFPQPGQLKKLSSIRESKKVGVDIEKYNPLIGEILYAFQDSSVLKIVSDITGLSSLSADPSLYASGVSLMEKGDFLNPHLDNSHDGDKKLFRVLNILYYVSPSWDLTNGGNLELWEPGIKNGNEIFSKFNRLVVMATDRFSWHSVNEVLVNSSRYCVSNYYFSPNPPSGKQYFHVTTFSGRPDESGKGLLLRVDGVIRNAVRRVFPKGFVATTHRRNNDNR